MDLAAALLERGYRVVEEVGRGGLGLVFHAVEVGVGRSVAIKVLHARAPSSRQLERFRREAIVGAHLTHPGVVAVHQVGDLQGRPFMVSQFVDGARTLGSALRELDLDDRVELVAQVAAAVGHAHAQGVIHRDLKPENVLVDPHGNAKVTDFGLAYLRSANRLTQTGACVGTPYYMAPEQFRSKTTPTPSTDVWALGVILYQALTGELPFREGSMLALSAKIAEARPVRPRDLDPNIPRSLERVCLECLLADPARRPQSANELALRLREGEPQVPTRSSSPPLIALIVATGAAALGAVLLLLTRTGGPPSPQPEPDVAQEVAAGEVPADDVAQRLEAGDPAGALALLGEAPRREDLELHLRALIGLGRYADAARAAAQAKALDETELELYALARFLDQPDKGSANPDLRVMADLSLSVEELEEFIDEAHAEGLILNTNLRAADIRGKVEGVLTLAEQVHAKWSRPLLRPVLQRAQDACSQGLAVHISAFLFVERERIGELCERTVNLLPEGDGAQRATVVLALNRFSDGNWNDIRTTQRAHLLRSDPTAWCEPLKPELRFFAYALWVMDHPERLDLAERALKLMDGSSLRGLEACARTRISMFSDLQQHLVVRAYEALRDGDPAGPALALEGQRIARLGYEGKWSPDYHWVCAQQWVVAELLAGDRAGAEEALSHLTPGQAKRILEVELAILDGDHDLALEQLPKRRLTREELAQLAFVIAIRGRRDEALATLRKVEPQPLGGASIPWREPHETLRILTEGTWWPGAKPR